MEVRGHRAGRRGGAGLRHQVPGRGPIGMAIEQRADDATVEHAGEGFVMRLRMPLGDDGAVLRREAADAQPLGVGGSAAEAGVVRRVAFLEAGLGHGGDSQ